MKLITRIGWSEAGLSHRLFRPGAVRDWRTGGRDVPPSLLEWFARPPRRSTGCAPAEGLDPGLMPLRHQAPSAPICPARLSRSRFSASCWCQMRQSTSRVRSATISRRGLIFCRAAAGCLPCFRQDRSTHTLRQSPAGMRATAQACNGRFLVWSQMNWAQLGRWSMPVYTITASNREPISTLAATVRSRSSATGCRTSGDSKAQPQHLIHGCGCRGIQAGPSRRRRPTRICRR